MRLLPQNGVLIVIIDLLVLVLEVDLNLVVASHAALLVATRVELLLVLYVRARVVLLIFPPIYGLGSVYRPLSGAGVLWRAVFRPVLL